MVKALAVAGRDQQAKVQEVALRAPGNGEVVVRTEAASVNGIDVAAAAGYLWDMMPHEFPVVLGRDFAGTVESVGAGVDRLRVGDRVAGVITAMSLGPGALAEKVLVTAESLVPVPDEVSATQAAGAGLAAVAAHDLVAALDLSPEDVVLVSGATGGVGAFAVQLAARSGATVLGTARPGESADFVRSLGATDVVDHTGDLAGAVAAAAPDGLTTVVHAAGDPAALGALLAAGGRLVSSVGATAEAVGRADVTVIPVMAVATPDLLADNLAAVAAGELVVPVAAIHNLDTATQALIDFGSPKLGKLLVVTDTSRNPQS